MLRPRKERFPDTDRTYCRFGRVITAATIEDDGTEGGISQWPGDLGGRHEPSVDSGLQTNVSTITSYIYICYVDVYKHILKLYVPYTRIINILEIEQLF